MTTKWDPNTRHELKTKQEYAVANELADYIMGNFSMGSYDDAKLGVWELPGSILERIETTMKEIPK